MDKFITHKYGEFKESQVDYYKQNYERKYFGWCYTLIRIDVVEYHKNLLSEISSCNQLLLYPKDFVEIVNSLESALTVLESDEFDFKKYKKLVFDAGALLQRMKVGDK